MCYNVRMKTLKHNLGNKQGEAEMLPLSFVEAVKRYQYQEAKKILKKEISWKDKHLSQKAYEFCIRQNAKELTEYILKHHILESFSPIGEASMDIFALIPNLRLHSFPEEETLPVYFEALRSPQAEEKLKLLIQWGLPLDGTDSDGKDLITLLEEAQKETDYRKGKRGDLESKRDARIIETLKRRKADGKLSGAVAMRRRIRLVIVLIALIFLGFICYAVGYRIAQGAGEGISNLFSISESTEAIEVESTEVE